MMWRERDWLEHRLGDRNGKWEFEIPKGRCKIKEVINFSPKSLITNMVV